MVTKTRKRKAWVVVADRPRPPLQGYQFGGVQPGEPLAVLPSRWSAEKVKIVVDAFVQNFWESRTDMLDFLIPGRFPYAAKSTEHGQEVTGGFNPYVEAFWVDDLRVCTDDETGREWFEFTRRPPTRLL